MQFILTQVQYSSFLFRELKSPNLYSNHPFFGVILHLWAELLKFLTNGMEITLVRIEYSLILVNIFIISRHLPFCYIEKNESSRYKARTKTKTVVVPILNELLRVRPCFLFFFGGKVWTDALN